MCEWVRKREREDTLVMHVCMYETCKYETESDLDRGIWEMEKKRVLNSMVSQYISWEIIT